MQALVQPHSVSHLVTTRVVFENSPEPSTTATHTLVILVKTGVLEPTGLASPGRMHKETSLETLQPKMITSGTRMQPRLQSQFLTKDRKMATLHSRLMIQPPSKKHTTTASTLVLFLSECTARPTVAQPVFNPTSRISHSVQTVCKALRLATVLVTPSVRRTLAVKSTSSHPEAAVQARCPSSSRQWFTSRRTTLVKFTCPFSIHMER